MAGFALFGLWIPSPTEPSGSHTSYRHQEEVTTMFESTPGRRVPFTGGQNESLTPQEIELRGLEAAISDPNSMPHSDLRFFFQQGPTLVGPTLTSDAEKKPLCGDLAGFKVPSKPLYSSNQYTSLEAHAEGQTEPDILDTIMNRCLFSPAVGGTLPTLAENGRLDGSSSSMLQYSDKLSVQDSAQFQEDVSLLSCLDDLDDPKLPKSTTEYEQKRDGDRLFDDRCKQDINRADLLQDDDRKVCINSSERTSRTESLEESSSCCSSLFDKTSLPRKAETAHKIDQDMTPEMKLHVESLRKRIEGMPRRKLRESLATEITIEDVEPLMSVNRDEVAGLLGVGVTTWKAFVHKTLGIARWPARGIKSLQSKETSLRLRMREANEMHDACAVRELKSELSRLHIQREIDRTRRRAMAEGKRRQTLRSNKKAL